MCCHGSGIVFHPHCAEWDILLECPRVSLMALVCGAVTGHAQHQSSKCTVPLTTCSMLHLSGVLCVPNYGSKTSNTRFTANVSSYSCVPLMPFEAFCTKAIRESTDMEVQVFCEEKVSRLLLISAINMSEG